MTSKGTSLSRRDLLRLAAMSGVVAACGAPSVAPTASQASATAAAKPQGKLRVGGTVGADLQPNNILAGASQGYLLFDGLTWPAEGGVLQPHLATSWRVLDDKVTWEFKLRQGVTFSNGEPFNAGVVKYTVDKTLKEKLRWAGRLATIKDVRVIDDYTVQIVTNGPDGLLPGRMMVFMLPPKEVEAVGLDAFGRKPAGTGAYVVDKFVPGQSVILKYRPGNWREGISGLPGIPGKPEEIEWVNLADDAARMAALRAGSIDVAGDVPIDEIRPLQESGFTVSSVAEASPQIFYLLAAADSTAPNPLNDVKVRQAINYAVDVKTMCDQLFLGLTKPSPGQVTGPDAFGYNPKLTAFGYDPAKARQLLADAGYPNGFTVKAEIRPGALGSTTGQAVASYLGKVGIKVELLTLESTLWTQKIYNGGRAPMFMQGVNYLPMYDADFSYVWFWSKNPAIVAKAPFFKNARFDQIFEQQEKEVDRSKREVLLQELGTILYEEAPVLFLFNQVRAYAASKKVKGLKVSADQMVYFENISVGG